MNRKTCILYWLAIVLYVVTMLILFQFLPDMVPLHLGANGEFGRIEEKREFLIQFIIPLLASISLFPLSTYYRKKKIENAKALIIFGIVLSVFATIFNGTYMAKITGWIPESIGMEKIIVWLLGLLLCACGWILYTVKTEINSIFGVRTKWSTQSKSVWDKSQKAGGQVLIVTGIFTLIIGLFFNGTLCTIAALSLLAISVLIAVYLTYRISMKY